LINSLGRVDGSNPSVTVIEVEQGKRYRFGLLSASCHPSFTFSIDGYDNVTIIEVHGQNTEPLLGIDEIPIYTAQRYSFVERLQLIGNYWIRALPEQLNPSTYNTSTAILRYVGAPAEDPQDDLYTTAPEVKNPLLEQNLLPELDADCDKCNLTLDFAFNGQDFTVNVTLYVNPPVPVLLQILNGLYTPQQLMGHDSVLTLPCNKMIQITMPGQVVGGPHPIHLHGVCTISRCWDHRRCYHPLHRALLTLRYSSRH
ncbi:multicopper oxidase, partial [Daedalea quercina L-15889]